MFALRLVYSKGHVDLSSPLSVEKNPFLLRLRCRRQFVVVIDVTMATDGFTASVPWKSSDF